MKSSNKPYGLRGELSQSTVFKDFREEWSQDGIDFLIKNSCIEMSFTDPDKEDLAKRIANTYVRAWAMTNSCPLSINYNVSWKPNTNNKGRAFKLDLEDRVGLSEFVTTVSSDRKMVVTGTSDSISIAQNKDLAMRSLSNPILEEALRYYSEEIAGSDNPLYGIYKSIEVITHAIGMETLAQMAGVNKKYISDVMQTTQIKRHAITFGRRKLSDSECKERAKKLIIAYSQH